MCVGLQVKCKVGDTVSKGQVVVVLEAMKMEYPITAPAAGQVSTLRPLDAVAYSNDQACPESHDWRKYHQRSCC